MYEYTYPNKRFKQTIYFVKKHIKPNEVILDLGVDNPMAKIMREEGYQVKNTVGEDLDDDLNSLKSMEYDVVTAFEILEHLVSPYPLLKSIECNKLIVTVPLKLWFASAYWNKEDERDRHFHEFEAKQLDMLLNKAGWKIIDHLQWTNPVRKIGIRPLLRYFVPRYYAVYCEKIA